MLRKVNASPKFSKIFTPGYIGNLPVKNRLVRAPMMSCFANPDGSVNQNLINHYRDFAQGGTGVIIVEHAYVDDKSSQGYPCQLSASRLERQPGLGWLADTIKHNGAKACLQITHAGRQRLIGPPTKAASSIPWESIYATRPTVVPEAMTIPEIEELIEAFGNAALRAKLAGYDMTEIHGGHGYLLTNFLAPSTNKRNDLYGGSLKNRMRLLLKIIENARRKVGPDFPISVRLSAVDYVDEEPITIEETREVAKAVEKAGADILHISAGIHAVVDREVISMYWPLAQNVWAAEDIKRIVKIPVIASGAITSPELAEQILEEGKADFVSLGRPLLADPFFAVKAQEGRPEDVRRCIRCGECSAERGIGAKSIHCTVNPYMGTGEQEQTVIKTARPKKVAVIGGGPAGMEAARMAALKGHDVTLFEKRQLGGALIEASTPDFKADIRSVASYLTTQIKKTGVKVVKKEATVPAIKAGNFDTVVVATGATPVIPDVPGINKPSVVGLFDVFHGAKVGKTVIIIGGGMISSDLVLHLAIQGKKVIITTRGDAIAQGMNSGTRFGLFRRLTEYKDSVQIITGVRLAEVTSTGVIVRDRNEVKRELKGDNVIVAAGMVPNRDLFDKLSKVPGLEVYAVGDCVEPRVIYDAIHEGHIAGNTIA